MQHRLADGSDLAAMFCVHIRQQCLYQIGNIFLVLPQRWHRNIEDVQAVVQILTQVPVRHGVLGYLVGGGQDPYVKGGFDLAAETPQGAFFQHPQQLGLRTGRHLADFVQQQRPAFRQFEAANPAFHRSRESAFFMSENLTLYQCLRNSRAIDRDKRLIFPGAQLVNRTRHQFLTRAARAGDENRGCARRHHLNQPENLLHLLGSSHQPAQRALVAQRPSHRFLLHPVDLPRRCVLQNGAQPRKVHWLADVVIGAAAHRLHGIVDTALSCEQNNGDGIGFRFELLQQLHATHARHLQIGQNNRGREGGDFLQPFHAVAGRLRLVSPRAHQFGKSRTLVLFVFNDQHSDRVHRFRSTLVAITPPRT